MSRTIRIGSRASALAQAQTRFVRDLLQKRFPDSEFAIQTFKTEGDRVQETPLWQMEGRDFWVKELDSALLAGDVDLTVHSLKDLSLTRPNGIFLGAIPHREDPRDILMLRREPLQPHVWRLGTSSPRRQVLLEHFWDQFMKPNYGPCQIVPLRGNVPTRVSRLVTHDDKALDGVCIASAGLFRMLGDLSLAGDALRHAVGLTNSYILPVFHFPGAPGQGALAVECREDDGEIRAMLGKIHLPTVNADIARERAVLQAAGGGCHSPVSATVVDGALFHTTMKAQTRVLSSAQTADTTVAWSKTLFVGSFSDAPEHLNIYDPLSFRPVPEWEVAYAHMPRPHILCLTSARAAEIMIPPLLPILGAHIRSGAVVLAAVGRQTWTAASRLGITPQLLGQLPGRDALFVSIDSLFGSHAHRSLVYATRRGLRGRDLPPHIHRLEVYEEVTEEGNIPNFIEKFEGFVFSSYSCFEAFTRANVLEKHHRVWVRSGPSLEKVQRHFPTAQAWTDTMFLAHGEFQNET
jgi:hydroxymethylbilane synthase